VPIAEFGHDDHLFDYTDLATLLGLPLLIVARAHLGTLNHTFLTVRYARERATPVIGVVLNGRDPAADDPSVDDNAAMIEEMCAVPVLGTLDRIEGLVDVDVMARACRESIDLDRIHDLSMVQGDTV
jgi:dethiobiotin synthetase